MIIYFSGTGNSRRVATLLAEKLGDSDIIAVDSATLDNPQPLTSAGPCVWVMPVHSWGLPKAARSALTAWDVTAPSHSLVLTCGDDTGLAHRQWQSLAASRGWHTRGMWSVQMPNTYVSLPGFDVDSPELTASKLEAMPARVEAISRAIAAGSDECDVVTGSVPGLKTRIIYPLFMRCLTSPRRFKCDTGRCIGCGKCVKACPLSNIVLDPVESTPRYGDRCTLCLACYHVCPQHAISYGASRRKGQYYLD